MRAVFVRLLAAVSIAALSGCVTPAAAAARSAQAGRPGRRPRHRTNSLPTHPDFLRLSNMAKDKTPLRVGVILPFSNASAGTRALANAMLKAAELALYDSGNRDIVLMTADDSAKPAGSRRRGATGFSTRAPKSSSARSLPHRSRRSRLLARDRGVPVIAFSTDRTVAGNGVYLLSFQPENEVHRVVAYALAQGHKNFAALIPSTGYGKVSERAFREAVKPAAERSPPSNISRPARAL